MPPRLPLAPLLLALFSTAVGGCSFAFVHGPPPNHKTSAFFDCTSGNALPIIDSVLAAGALIDAVGAGAGSSSFVNNDGTMSTSSVRATTALVYGASAALLAVSAGYGFKRTSACRDAEADLVRRTPVTPAFAGAPRLLAPPTPYDPWVAHPAIAPVGPVVTPAPTAPAAAGAPPPAAASPWDGPAPGK
jgi:hypothetical protein